jgi:hypothetical protein
MKTKWKAALAGIALISLSGAAAANDRVHFSLNIGLPAPMVTYAPPVAYYPPAPVYVAPRVYHPAPVYWSPPPRAMRIHHGHWRGHDRRHWNRY